MNTRLAAVICAALLASACSGNPTGLVGEAGRQNTVPPALEDALAQELERVLLQSGRDRTASAPPLQARNRVEDITAVDDGAGGVIVSFAYLNVGDYNQDGLVSINDLTPIGVGFNVTSDSPDWFLRGVADGNADGAVNISDITAIGQNWGNAVTGYIVEMTETPEDDESWTEVGEVLLSEGTKTTADMPASRQIMLEVAIAELPVTRSWSVRSFLELTPGDRQYGIATFEEEVIPLTSNWGQIGGNAGHTGMSATIFPEVAEYKYVVGGGHGFDLSAPPVSTATGDWLFGTSDGTVTKTDNNMDVQWQTGLGKKITALTVAALNTLIVTDKSKISFLDTVTGALEQQTLFSAITAPRVYASDATQIKVAVADSLGMVAGIRYAPGSPLEIEWSHNFNQPSPDGFKLNITPQIVGDSLAIQMGSGDGNKIAFIGQDGSNPMFIQEGMEIKGRIQLDSAGLLWAMLNDGAQLQRYNQDGSKSSSLLPQAGDKFTAMATDPDEQKLYTGYRAGIGVGKLRIWNIQLGEEEDHVVVDKAPDKLLATANRIISYTIGLNGGTVTSYGHDLNKNWETEVEWLSLSPRISLSHDIAGDGTTVFKSNWAYYLDANGSDPRWGYNLGGSRPFTALSDDNAIVGKRLGMLPLEDFFDPNKSFVLGGLTGNIQEPHGEIPILSKVPLAGGLFRNRAGQSQSSSEVVLPPFRITFTVDKQASSAADAGFTLYEDDGSLAWDFPLTDAQVSPAAFDTDRFLLTATPASGSQSTLYCLAELDGELLWDAVLPGATITTPTLDAAGRCAVATDDGTVSCFDDTGASAWTASHPVVASGLMVDSGRLYFASGASLFILSMVDGSTLHEVSLPGAVEGSSPSICADGQVVVGTAAGALVKVDPTDTSPAAILHALLGAGCSSQPVCDPLGNIIVATVDGAVQCLDPDGNQLWKVETGLAQWLELSVASDGTIYAAGSNGGTYVIGPPE